MVKKVNLTKEDKNLINIAKEVSIKNYVNNKDISCDVASALITDKNNVYQGINIESKMSAPTSICGETGAIASMVANGERKIKAIVAVSADKEETVILPPCGSCRHIISQFGNPWVIISKTKKIKLNELYPLIPR